MAGIVNQINDICPHCGKDVLHYREPPYPYDSYLSCLTCDSTYLLKYNPLWTEDVNNIGCDMMDIIEKEFKDRGIILSDVKSDELYDKIRDFLDSYSVGYYRNQMG